MGIVHSMPRWLVISNCQARGLAHSLALQAPQLEVEWCEFSAYLKNREDWTARLPQFAKIIVISQVYGDELKQDTADMDVMVVPPLFFPGYHPDEGVLIVDCSEENGPGVWRKVNGPLGIWHSLIAFSGHRRGLDVAKTVALYRKETYEAMDYLDWWSRWRMFLLDEFAACGLDISTAFNRWSRGRAFMHNSAHPRVECLFDIAGMILAQNGYPPQRPNCTPDDFLVLDACFPVYPEIAAGLGFEGSYLFKPGGAYRCLDLETFVRQSFDVYETYAPGRIRVEKRSRHFLDVLETL
jgi:hypothetical protein